MFTESQNKSMGSSNGATARNIFHRKMFTGSQNKSVGSSAFTLIEVMVAVMIISVVIAALLQMRGNSTHIFMQLDKKLKINQYMSFLISNENFGFENDNISLDEIVSEFDLEDELRRKLKGIHSEVVYQEISTIDMSEFEAKEEDPQNYDNQDEESKSAMVFEVGKSILKTKDSSAAILRLRLQ